MPEGEGGGIINRCLICKGEASESSGVWRGRGQGADGRQGAALEAGGGGWNVVEGAGGKELRPCWVTTVPRASIFRLAGLGDLSEQTPRGPLTSSSREDESPRETSCRALLEPRPREVRGWGRPVAHLGHPGLQTSNPPHFEGAGGGPSMGSRR